MKGANLNLDEQIALEKDEMKLKMHGIALCAAFASIADTAWGQQSPPPKGVYSFGADQTIADQVVGARN